MSLISSIPVVDSDTHVTEPPDLWTSRLPRRFVDDAPRIDVDPTTNALRWRVGDRWLSGIAKYSAAGWPEYPPSYPPTLEEADPGSWRAEDRLQRMDEYGIWAQILYPNLIAFEAFVFMNLEPELALACATAYNDFISDFASADPARLIPIAMLPFWDKDASIREMKRCYDKGHKGVLFANRYERAGLPSFYDPYWDEVYATAQEMDLSINFHIAFAQEPEGLTAKRAQRQVNTREHAASASLSVMSNADVLASLLTSGLCDRFPRLKFVSVESGFGYVPYLLESLDWHFLNHGAHLEFPDSLLPSEYFRRQVYGSFWFERGTLAQLESYPDNFMFETDYPHSTSLSPGAASPAEVPSVHIEKHLSGLSPETLRKVLHDNAASIYHLD